MGRNWRAVFDVSFMRRALELSARGLGETSPNPIVGAVIVAPSGEIIGSGFHAGGDHAEAIAIASASHIPEGSTLYVTLEPCNHTGKRPPCTQAILESGIQSVVYAVADPNPIASGGAERLRAAGVQVQSAMLAEEVAWSNRDWLTKIQLGRPRFVWKIASTLDGLIAAADGTSKWITCDESRERVSLLRSQADAIVIGSGTALADNPRLNSRHGKNPIRIVVGTRSIPQDFHIHDDSAETFFISSISELMDLVTSRGFNRVLVEAGPTLGTSLLKANLIDEIHLFQAPSLIGAGKSFISDLGINTLSDRRDFSIKSISVSGTDIETILEVPCLLVS